MNRTSSAGDRLIQLTDVADTLRKPSMVEQAGSFQGGEFKRFETGLWCGPMNSAVQILLIVSARHCHSYLRRCRGIFDFCLG